jgi:hypothetical protein
MYESEKGRGYHLLVQDREHEVEIFEPIGQAKVDDRQSCHAPQIKGSP